MKEYEINDKTLAIVPIDEERSIVYEDNEVFSVDLNSNKIMEDSCLYFGSTLEGRRKGTEKMTGIMYKAPIIVDELNEIIFFPTASSRYQIPAWIGIKQLKNYYKDNNYVVVEFQNHQKIILKVTYGILDNQVLRATRLESVLRGRKNQKNI